MLLIWTSPKFCGLVSVESHSVTTLVFPESSLARHFQAQAEY